MVNTTELVSFGTGEAAKAMILPSGAFEFYAISTNSSTETVPEFDTKASNGIPLQGNAVGGDGTTKANLKNGVDYLHAKVDKTIQFGSASIEVPLQFSHKGTQVQLKIIFGGNVGAEDTSAAGNFALAKVYVQQTDPANSYMRLNSGEIRFGNFRGGSPIGCNVTTIDGKEQLTNYTNMASMQVVKLDNYQSGSTTPATQVATYNMLPLLEASNDGVQKLWVAVEVENICIGGTTALTDGANVAVHVWKGTTPSETQKAAYSNTYTVRNNATGKADELVPTGGAMKVESADGYRFYALLTNSAQIAVPGLSSDCRTVSLRNGVDYLMAVVAFPYQLLQIRSPWLSGIWQLKSY